MSSFKGKLLVQKLLHGSHNFQGKRDLYVAQDPLHGGLSKQVMILGLRGTLKARVASTFSWERAMARMQPRIEKLGSILWEGRLEARHQLQELVRAKQPADASTSSLQPLAPTSVLSSSGKAQQQQQQASAGSAANLAVKDDDAMFGHDGLVRQVLLKSVASLSSTFMQRWNTTEVTGSENMEAALKRPQGQGLVTVCNHVAAMDDPLVMASLVPPHYFDQPSSLRWTLCATDRCFKYAGLSQLFTAMKVLPVQRGAGMKQPGLAAAESRVASGDWVHLFPEGTRSRTPSQMGPLRKGVGRLVAAAAEQAEQQGGQLPLVVPFVHAGMEDVMPVGKLLPSTGQTVKVVVGKPIAMDDLLRAAKVNAWTEDVLYTAITNRIQACMHAMHTALHTQEAELAMDDSTTLAAASCTPSYHELLQFSPGLSRGFTPSLTPAQGLLASSLFRSVEANGVGSEDMTSAEQLDNSCVGVSSCSDTGSDSGIGQQAGLPSSSGNASEIVKQGSHGMHANVKGLALHWMRRLQQGVQDNNTSPPGLCAHMCYGFGLPSRHAVAAGF